MSRTAAAVCPHPSIFPWRVRLSPFISVPFLVPSCDRRRHVLLVRISIFSTTELVVTSTPTSLNFPRLTHEPFNQKIAF